MALKDWKKVGPLIWHNKKNKKKLYVIKNAGYDIWRIELRLGLEGRILKQFDNKTQGIKFVRTYIKTH